MRSSLVAAGGALLITAAVFGTAGSAAADIWSDHSWNEHPRACGLVLNDDSTYHHITKHGVFAGTRDADACKDGHKHHWGWDDDADDDD
ncbi:hypothetical protein ABZW11_20995 [Nonomuraea sp. NPDC004580]|uniref:hypothetical protein n=1 Tax=Nonomuraea sp. NPDC004580 TaxID=3154552 RepID=UPI0033A8A89F